MAEVEIALYNILRAHSRVSGLVGNRIYPNHVPETLEKPAIVYLREGIETISVFGSDARLAAHYFSVLALGRTYLEARAVYNAFDVALRRNMGQGLDDVFLEDLIDRYHDETNTYCIDASYKIWASNNLPTLLRTAALVCILRVWVPHNLDGTIQPMFEDLDGDDMTFSVSVTGTGAEARIRDLTTHQVLETRGLVRDASASVLLNVDDGRGGVLDFTFPVTALPTVNSYDWLIRPAAIGATQVFLYTTALDADQIVIGTSSSFTIAGDTTVYMLTDSTRIAAVTEGFGGAIDITPALNVAVTAPAVVTFTS